MDINNHEAKQIKIIAKTTSMLKSQAEEGGDQRAFNVVCTKEPANSRR